MSDRDFWSKWLKRRRWPLYGRWMSDDMDLLFNEMEELMAREFGELSRKAPKSLERERVLPNGTRVKEYGPYVYGYSMTMGPDGKPVIREFGNIKPVTHMGKPELSVKERREPLVDLLETDGVIRVVAELPGVDKKDIKLHGTETSLTITVDTPQRKFYKEVNLTAEIDPKQAKSTYNNGVLEITLTKKEKTKLKGETINIE